MIPLIFSQDIQQALSDMLMGFFSAVPKLILAFIILITGIVISGLSSKLVEKTLNRFNLERYTDKLNQIDFIYKNNIRIRIEKIAGKTVKYLILLVFIILY